MKKTLKWFGQSAFEITIGDYVTFIDPWLNSNPQSHIKADELERVDLIVATHGHGDHLGDAFEIMRNTGSFLICSPEIGFYALSKGLKKAERIAQGGTIKKGPLSITAVHAVHMSTITEEGWDLKPDYQRTALPDGNPMGYVLRTDDGVSIYHAGDTDIFMDMQFIESRYHPDVAILPVGGRFTMDWETAVEAAKLLKPKVVIPMHFNFTPVSVIENQFVEKMNRELPNIEVAVLKPGESYTIKES